MSQCANQQPWFFSVITDPTHKRRVREAAEAEDRSFYEERAPQEWLDALAPQRHRRAAPRPLGHADAHAQPRELPEQAVRPSHRSDVDPMLSDR
jgi:nitroreductase